MPRCGIARRLRPRGRSTATRRARVRPRRRLRAAPRLARRPPRRRRRARGRHERRPAGVRLLRRGAARRAPGPRARRGADLRPAAEDPRAARRRRRCRSRWTRRGSTRTRSSASSRGGETSFLYTIPTFQNPSGRTLSTERRRRVVELAREHGVPVLEDDPVRARPLRGRGAAVAARARGRRARHVRVLVLEDRRAGRAGRLVRRRRPTWPPGSRRAPSPTTSRRRS